MWQWLRRLIKRPPVAARPPSAIRATQGADAASADNGESAGAGRSQFELLNQLVPLQKQEASQPGNPPVQPALASFVRREPVLNRQEQIAGYAFNLHERLQLRLQGERDLLLKVYDDALLRNLTSLGVNALLGHRLAFIRLSPASLENPLLEQLPVDNTVLMLTPGRQMLDMARLSAQLAGLRERGYVWGWHVKKSQLTEHPALLALAAQGDYVQIEVSGFDGMDIKLLQKDLASVRQAGLPRLKLIGHELDSYDEFHVCFKGGFDYFSGRFITSRENWHPPKGAINRLQVMELLNLLRSDAELKLIAEQLSQDPVMSFKLLRYINSAAMGLQSPLATLDKALLVLGRERFYRWLSLLLFDIKAPGFRERLLTEQALARAHFLESLAGVGQVPDDGDGLFILGLFSMLDLLMGQPLERILQQTRLPENVMNTLLGAPGPWQDVLQLACASEEAAAEQLESLAERCGLDALQVTHQAINALNWAHSVVADQEAA